MVNSGEIEGQLAVQTIKQWKENPEIRKKFKDDFRLYAFFETEKVVWDGDPALQAEFSGDFECYVFYRTNEYRARVLGGVVKSGRT